MGVPPKSSFNYRMFHYEPSTLCTPIGTPAIFAAFSEVNFDYWSSPRSVPWRGDGPRLSELGARWDTESKMSELVSAKFFASLEAKGPGTQGPRDSGPGWQRGVVSVGFIAAN